MSDLAAKLVDEGPFQQEPTKRRIRGLLGGQWVFDTLDAVYVWEHKYYPMYYVPLDAVKAGPGKIALSEAPGDKGFSLGSLQSGDKSANITVFEKGPLSGLVKVAADAVEWYSEDEKLLGNHPKDPYKRIECLPSSREVRIEVDGTVVARSTNSVFLHETMLRTRYYLTPSAILDWVMLSPSETSSFCPYKGKASYYHLKVGGREIRDAIWYYDFPLAESAQIQGRLCFYNEKVDVFIDGKKEEK